MKLFDKLKNALFEEEYVEVEEPNKKESVIAKKIETPKREVVKEEDQEETDEDVADRDLLKGDSNFKFPMNFEDDDFIEESVQENTSNTYQEAPKPYQNDTTYSNYNHNHNHIPYEKKEEKKGFKPSPIISPIYGVLDQNYRKDEIIVKRDIRITSSYDNSKLDFDEIRAKAYGDLSSELNLTGNIDSKIENVSTDEEEVQTPDNLLVDMSDDTTPTVEKVTVGDAEEYFADLGLEYNVDYKDASKEKATGRRINRKTDVEEKMEDSDEATVDASINEPLEDKDNDSDSDNNLEDNLFDLIDSMYDEES